MKAAIVSESGHPPHYGDFREPVAGDGVVVVDVVASALSHLTKMRASGAHYSSGGGLPFVPGVDGVGTCGGRRVYFLTPEAPFGGMAERTAVREDRLLAVPDDVDDVTAAAIANAGMSSWAALCERARLQPGETVLVNGATGTSGRLAVGIAKHLGAKRVIATGRNVRVLQSLRDQGADATVALSGSNEELEAALATEFRTGVDVVLDYLWGPSAEAIVRATASASDPARAVRLVNIGTVAAPAMGLPGQALRSSGLIVMGSGLGSVSLDRLLHAIGGVFGAVNTAGLTIEANTVPLAEVEASWSIADSERLVFTI